MELQRLDETLRNSNTHHHRRHRQFLVVNQLNQRQRHLLALHEEQEHEQEQEQEQEDNEFIDIDTLDDAVIDTELRSTTQLGISRIEASSDTYCPGTLPPRLYQTNPFSRGQEDDETSVITHQLTSKEMAPTMKEIQAMVDAEEEQALTQAIDTFITTTRVGRAAKASTKVLDNRKQAKADEWAKASGHREGRGRSRGGSRSGKRGGRA